MQINVFVENEAGSNIKNLHDEKKLVFKKSVEVSREYPFPYGFILDTTSGDGDNLDAFILTHRKLKRGEVVIATPIALMKQVEDGDEDHNVIAVLEGEEFQLTEDIKTQLVEFVRHVFDHLDKHIEVAGFKSADSAEALIKTSLD